MCESPSWSTVTRCLPPIRRPSRARKTRSSAKRVHPFAVCSTHGVSTATWLAPTRLASASSSGSPGISALERSTTIVIACWRTGGGADGSADGASPWGGRSRTALGTVWREGAPPVLQAKVSRPRARERRCDWRRAGRSDPGPLLQPGRRHVAPGLDPQPGTRRPGDPLQLQPGCLR